MIETTTTLKDLRVVSVSERTSKKGNRYLSVCFNDDAGDRVFAVDNDLSRAERYVPGSDMTISVDLKIGRFVSIIIRDVL